jgi:uncharacterized repeat protein (TIGR02543 family)
VTLYAIFTKTLITTLQDYSGTTLTTRIIPSTFYSNIKEVNMTVPALNNYTGWTSRGWSQGRAPDEKSAYVALQNRTVKEFDAHTTFYGLYQQAVTVSYNANGGASTPSGRTGLCYVNSYNIADVLNLSVTLPSAITRAGYTFDGWVSSANGTKFNAGASVKICANTTFTAAWK